MLWFGDTWERGKAREARGERAEKEVKLSR